MYMKVKFLQILMVKYIFHIIMEMYNFIIINTIIIIIIIITIIIINININIIVIIIIITITITINIIIVITTIIVIDITIYYMDLIIMAIIVPILKESFNLFVFMMRSKVNYFEHMIMFNFSLFQLFSHIMKVILFSL